MRGWPIALIAGVGSGRLRGVVGLAADWRGAAVVEGWPVGWGTGVCRRFVERTGCGGVGHQVRKGSRRAEEGGPEAGTEGVGVSENAHFFSWPGLWLEVKTG